MPNLVLTDLPTTLASRLEARARLHGREPAAEALAIIESALLKEPNLASSIAARIRDKLAGRVHQDSAVLLAVERGR